MVAVMMNGSIKDDLPDELWTALRSVAFNLGDTIHDFDGGLKVKPLKGAMTNEVYQITWPMKENGLTRNVIVRIYGEGVDLFFNREDEIRTFECMSKHGQGPRLLGRFGCGRIEEFIHARTLSAADLRDPSISALIAAKLREFHDLDMPGSRKVLLWDRMRNWVNEAKRLCSKEDIKEFRVDVVAEELHLLEKELSSSSQAIGFCHNDLQYGNIMMDEETKSITIIDYEYASYNPVAYDLANHFCEMGANYHTETPHVLDYTLYPDEEERRRFATIYLNSAGDKSSDDEVKKLLNDVEKYTLPNHLFWGLWGLISSYVNDIEFDYKEYARQRFRQYWSTKPLLLGSAAACDAET